MVLDKTGTIIKGEPKRTELVTASGVDDDHLLLMRISDFLDIKFGTVDTVVGTASPSHPHSQNPTVLPGAV